MGENLKRSVQEIHSFAICLFYRVLYKRMRAKRQQEIVTASTVLARPFANSSRLMMGEGCLDLILGSPPPPPLKNIIIMNKTLYIKNKMFKTFSWVNPFRTKPPKYLFPRGNKPLLYHQIGNRNFLYFHCKSVKLDVLCMCRQNKIWTFGNPFRSKKLSICTYNSDLQSLYMLPIWGFTNFFRLK